VISSSHRRSTGGLGQGGALEASGRTLVTRVVAGRTDVSFFFFVPASELIRTEDEAGADRVRNAYEQAMRVASVVLVIDQPDPTGMVRGGADATSGEMRWRQGDTVVPPDLDARRRILRDCTPWVRLAEDVDLQELAAATPDMVAADLGGLIAEAALLAAIRGHSRVTRSDFSEALEQLTLENP
jgi:cell division protease FtsH